MDPVINPSESPFAAFSNNPIAIIDPNGSTPIYHEVKKGDNLSKIAERYGTSVHLLAEMNGIKDPSKIQIGQVLTVGTVPNPSDLNSIVPVQPTYEELTSANPQVAFGVSGAYSTALSLYSGKYNSYASVPSSVMATLTESQKQSDFATNSPKASAILIWEFLSGTGPDHRSFNESHPITKEIMFSGSSNLAIWNMVNDFQAGKYKDGEERRFYAAMAPDAGISNTESVRRHLNAWWGSPATFYRGGMTYHMTKVGNDIQVKVTDAYTIRSLIRVNVTLNRDPSGNITPLGTTTTEFNFTWKNVDFNAKQK